MWVKCSKMILSEWLFKTVIKQFMCYSQNPLSCKVYENPGFKLLVSAFVGAECKSCNPWLIPAGLCRGVHRRGVAVCLPSGQILKVPALTGSCAHRQTDSPLLILSWGSWRKGASWRAGSFVATLVWLSTWSSKGCQKIQTLPAQSREGCNKPV